jgi:hypothetical protein
MSAYCPLCLSLLGEGPGYSYTALHESHRDYVRRAVEALEAAELPVDAEHVALTVTRLAERDAEAIDTRRRAFDQRN